MSETHKNISLGPKSFYFEHVEGDVTVNYNEKVIPKNLTRKPFIPEVFVGRAKELQAIHDHFFINDCKLLLLSGFGGIGKTSLAANYYHTYESKYKHIGWSYAETGLLNALLGFALPMQLDFPDDLPTESRLDLTLAAMAELEKPCLLVLDNTNNIDDLQRYYQALQSCPNFHVLLTTRITEFEQAKSIRVGTLEPGDSIALFEKYYPGHQDSDNILLKDILKAIGYNTLVIELMAKNLNRLNRLRTNYSLNDLLEDLQNNGLLALKNKEVKSTYKTGGGQIRSETPAAVIDAMYDLGGLSKSENSLMSIFSVLPAENIPFTILETLISNDQNIDDTLLDLSQRGWLDYNQGTQSFKVSPVIQEIVRVKNKERLSDDTQIVVDNLNLIFEEEFDLESSEKLGAEKLEQYVVYGVYIAYYVKAISGDLIILGKHLGTYYTSTGNLWTALTYFTFSTRMTKELQKAYPENIAISYNLVALYRNLGGIKSELGNLVVAHEFYNSAYQIMLQLPKYFELEDEEWKTNMAISLENMGNIYYSLGNTDEAIRFFLKANAVSEELHQRIPESVDHKHQFAVSFQNLGKLYWAIGDFENALESYLNFYQTEKELVEAFPKNPKFKYGLAIASQFIASALNRRNDQISALTYAQSFNHLMLELTVDYPFALDYKKSLASSYLVLGHIQNAMNFLDEALSLHKSHNQILEDLHFTSPDSASYKNGLAVSHQNLGNIYVKLGNTDDALKNFTSFHRFEKELFEEFPENVEFKFNYALSNWLLGDCLYRSVSKAKAKDYVLLAKDLMYELVRDFPDYLEYQQALESLNHTLANF